MGKPRSNKSRYLFNASSFGGLLVIIQGLVSIDFNDIHV